MLLNCPEMARNQRLTSDLLSICILFIPSERERFHEVSFATDNSANLHTLETKKTTKQGLNFRNLGHAPEHVLIVVALNRPR